MNWQNPRVLAHRGGGALAPENTLGAIRLGASLGFKGVEFDVMLAGDGTPVLMHDETLERTTGTKGEVARTPYAELAKLDAGSGERIPKLDEAASLCRSLGLWANVEIKPARGQERVTGEKVAELAGFLWRGTARPPLLSSFSAEALKAAQKAAPWLPRGLIVKALPADWQAQMSRLGCVSLHCSRRDLRRETVEAVKKAGYAVLCWTVNEPDEARRLLDWGVDCLVTDALKVIGPQFV
jgi:glycerophosphoryl diester phosphodiesterase